MVRISKIVKILLLLLIMILCNYSIVNATEINMNLPVENANDVATTETNEISGDLTNPTNEITSLSDDISGTAVPSNVSSIAQENMSFSNILNILLIAVGVVLILLAIAILIRLKH